MHFTGTHLRPQALVDGRDGGGGGGRVLQRRLVAGLTAVGLRGLNRVGDGLEITP